MAIKIMAERQAPGDRWLLTEEALAQSDFNDQVIQTSLTGCLNEIYKNTGETNFIVDAKKGEVRVETEKNKGPQVWDLYGERTADKGILNG
tara:strand:+ start:6280 stop:6552 length:273 start_codon:yes stop_codon:yes gene_type:complete